MKNTFFLAELFLLDLLACCHAYPQYPLPDIEDANFIEDCVRAHNSFRAKVKPQARNMLRMAEEDEEAEEAGEGSSCDSSPLHPSQQKSWDAALAKSAKAWAKQCKFKHNVYLKMPRKVHPTFTPVGENIWTGTATIFSVDAALSDWFEEVKSYMFDTNSCGGMCGHYTQVVWAESYKVGCAVHFCNTVEYFPGLLEAAHFVCNYGPAGNYPRKPYEAGQPCSGCSNEKCVDRLCENEEREKLIDYSNWHPDWDTQPRPPMPPPPPYIPPAEHRPPSCDQYCVSMVILRPLFLILCAGAVVLVQQRFPHTFFYE